MSSDQDLEQQGRPATAQTVAENNHAPADFEEANRSPAAGQVQNSLNNDWSSQAATFNRDQPGDWVVDLHRTGLIVKLNPYNNPVRSLLEWAQGVAGQEISPQPALEMGDRFCISFAELQRMEIRKLQCELIRYTIEMVETGKESPGWQKSLSEYVEAVKRHDYMESRKKSGRDPFQATGEKYTDHYLIMAHMNGDIANNPNMRSRASHMIWEQSDTKTPESICPPRDYSIAASVKDGFKKRVILAAAGGFFLLAPMWAMALHPGLWTSLAITTVFVSAFGGLMAYFLEDKDVMACTAAYAAVQVVFVGARG